MIIKAKNKYIFYILLFITIKNQYSNNNIEIKYRISLKNSEASKYLAFSIISTSGLFGGLFNIWKKNSLHRQSIHFCALCLSCSWTGWKQF